MVKLSSRRRAAGMTIDRLHLVSAPRRMRRIIDTCLTPTFPQSFWLMMKLSRSSLACRYCQPTIARRGAVWVWIDRLSNHYLIIEAMPKPLQRYWERLVTRLPQGWLTGLLVQSKLKLQMPLRLDQSIDLLS